MSTGILSHGHTIIAPTLTPTSTTTSANKHSSYHPGTSNYYSPYQSAPAHVPTSALASTTLSHQQHSNYNLHRQQEQNRDINTTMIPNEDPSHFRNQAHQHAHAPSHQQQQNGRPQLSLPPLRSLLQGVTMFENSAPAPMNHAQSGNGYYTTSASSPPRAVSSSNPYQGQKLPSLVPGVQSFSSGHPATNGVVFHGNGMAEPPHPAQLTQPHNQMSPVSMPAQPVSPINYNAINSVPQARALTSASVSSTPSLTTSNTIDTTSTYSTPPVQSLSRPMIPQQLHTEQQEQASARLHHQPPPLSTPGARKPKKKYECYICLKNFTTSGHLARHTRIHTGERNHVCPYEGCGARFSRQDNCMQHYRTHLKKNIRRKNGNAGN